MRTAPHNARRSRTGLAARQLRLAALSLAAVVAANCASTGATPRPFPQPRSSSHAAVVLADASGVAATALSFQGVPYRNGGADPRGFDCSGLVWYVFNQHGVAVPRITGDQFAAGERIEPAELQSGDLVFFSTIAPGPSHVGIVVSPSQFVHAPSSTGVVRVESLGAPYWASRYVGARRVR